MPFQLLSGLFIALVSLNLLTIVSGHGKAIGPSRPVCAIAGEEVLLPCHLTPPLSAEDMNVAWTTGRFNTTVHFHGNRTEHKERRDRKYQGRTDMITKDISRGSVVLRIHNIARSDEGTYTCRFHSDAAEASVGIEVRVADKSACDLKRELDILAKDRKNLQREVDRLTIERNALVAEKDALPTNIDDPSEKRGCLKFVKDIQLKEEELRWARSFADDVTLDADTAYPALLLSKDRRNVKSSNKAQRLPDTPERYDDEECVLGQQRISSGRHYWEVEVRGVVLWRLGVCDESSSRKGQITVSPEGGYWAVSNLDDDYKAHTSLSATPLYLSEHIRTVGIFLDYEAGRVSFYNVEERSLLFTYPDHPFSPRILRPYFCSGDIRTPLRLRTVTEMREKV